MADDLDVKKIARALKKTFQCNGTVTDDPELGEILQLSGDQRTNIRQFFVDQEVCHEDQIVIHGTCIYFLLLITFYLLHFYQVVKIYFIFYSVNNVNSIIRIILSY